jgi:hypothetical protein
MKVIVLTRGDLTNKLGMFLRTDNPYSDVRLNGQESAEAIVFRKSGRRAERKGVFKIWRICEQCKESSQSRYRA